MERYGEVLKAIFFVKLLHITDLLGLADNLFIDVRKVAVIY